MQPSFWHLPPLPCSRNVPLAASVTKVQASRQSHAHYVQCTPVCCDLKLYTALHTAVACVVHLSPLEVLRLPAYRQWLEAFGADAQHVLVAESMHLPAPIMRKSTILQASCSRNAVAPIGGLASGMQSSRAVLSCTSLMLLTGRVPLSPVLQAKLNLVDPALFPLLAGSQGNVDAELPANCTVGHNMLRYHLRPLAKKGIDKGEPAA